MYYSPIAWPLQYKLSREYAITEDTNQSGIVTHETIILYGYSGSTIHIIGGKKLM